MFIPDGSKLDYDSKKEIPTRYSWGWLGDEVPPDKLGWRNAEQKCRVVARLKSQQDCLVLQHLGSHYCGICEESIKNDYDWNGSFLIEYGGKSYRAPASVGHYIEFHDYNPGEEVIEAVLGGVYAGSKVTGQITKNKECLE